MGHKYPLVASPLFTVYNSGAKHQESRIGGPESSRQAIRVGKTVYLLILIPGPRSVISTRSNDDAYPSSIRRATKG